MRSGSRAERGRDPHGADAVSGAQRECLCGARHLRRTIAEFVEHYHGERNHQRLGNELIDGAPAVESVGRIHRRQRLGGLLNYYARRGVMFGDTRLVARLTCGTLRGFGFDESAPRVATPVGVVVLRASYPG